MRADRTTLHPDGRIHSWRAIAAFLGRDERTIRRWEKQRSLPVHRAPGERGFVFAYRDELLFWLQSSTKPSSPRLLDGACTNRVTITAPGAHGRLSPTPAQLSPESLAVVPEQTRGRWLFWVAALAFALFLFLADAYHGRLQAAPAPLRDSARISNRALNQPANLVTTPADVQQARELCLLGRYFWSRRTNDDLHRGLDSFTQAIVLDPGNADAYAGLAATYELMPEYSSMPLAEAFPRAVVAARRAVGLAPASAEAHRVLAFALFYGEWKQKAAFAEFRRAMELDPSNAEAHHWYATALLTLRRSGEARAEIERARELDPASRSILADQILIEAMAGADPAGCLQRLREIQRAEPGFKSPPRYISSLLLSRRDFSEWIAELKRAAADEHSPVEVALARAAQRGWQKGGERAMFVEFRRAQQRAFREGDVSAYDLALTCLRLGDREAALQYLEAAYRARDFRLLSIFRDPEDAALRGQPRYEALRNAVNRQLDAPA